MFRIGLTDEVLISYLVDFIWFLNDHVNVTAWCPPVIWELGRYLVQKKRKIKSRQRCLCLSYWLNVTVCVFLPGLFSHGRFSITTINQTITACINVVQGVGPGRLHAVRFARETRRRLRPRRQNGGPTWRCGTGSRMAAVIVVAGPAIKLTVSEISDDYLIALQPNC